MSSLNPHLRKPKRQRPSVADLVAGIQASNRAALGQGLTLVESQLSSDEAIAQELVQKCIKLAKPSIRIGITGTPGVGKSTFIESLGIQLIEQGHRVAVLAVDPSSQISGGSILGDKTRMPLLATNESAFIRPSPAGESLGGVARRSREGIILCEAAGFDVILVETVGVGQSEIAVHAMVDFFLLLLLPGAGDELQGIKRGIVEMADLVAVNKADDSRKKLAKQARLDYQRALHLFPPKKSEWTPRALTCSGLSGEGVAEIWAAVEEFRTLSRKNGYFDHNRSEQAVYWFRAGIQEALGRHFRQHPAIKTAWETTEEAVRKGDLSSYQAVIKLINMYLKLN